MGRFLVVFVLLSLCVPSLICALPSGTYQNSCSGCTDTNYLLHCNNCRTKSGGSASSSLDLNVCWTYTDIQNLNGILTCINGRPKPVNPTPWPTPKPTPTTTTTTKTIPPPGQGRQGMYFYTDSECNGRDARGFQEWSSACTVSSQSNSAMRFTCAADHSSVVTVYYDNSCQSSTSISLRYPQGSCIPLAPIGWYMPLYGKVDCGFGISSNAFAQRHASWLLVSMLVALALAFIYGS